MHTGISEGHIEHPRPRIYLGLSVVIWVCFCNFLNSLLYFKPFYGLKSTLFSRAFSIYPKIRFSTKVLLSVNAFINSICKHSLYWVFHHLFHIESIKHFAGLTVWTSSPKAPCWYELTGLPARTLTWGFY